MISYLITLISFIVRPNKRRLIFWSYKLRSKNGLEVGGPSSFFGLKGSFPIYVFAKNIDGVNFSSKTVWEGKIEKGKNYNYFKKKNGFQYIDEASELNSITSGSYDFVLSCHSLEHVANPVKALNVWRSLLKPGGKLVLVLPDKNYTFDIRRPYTSLQHLLDDFELNVSEYDTTHFAEILSCHNHNTSEKETSKEAIEEVLYDNYSKRCAHHHVFSLEMVRELLIHCGFETLYQQTSSPFHLVTIGKKKP